MNTNDKITEMLLSLFFDCIVAYYVTFSLECYAAGNKKRRRSLPAACLLRGRGYSGMFPCLRQGLSLLVLVASSVRLCATRARVSSGAMTALM